MTALQPGGDLVEPLWEPAVQVRLALTGAGSLGGIEVTGRWTGAITMTVSGVTNPTGKVTLTAPPISEDTLTFTVLTVVDAAHEYRPELNAVSQITVTRADAD
ncbi:MAG: hypothetical protein HKN74_13045 [Acidimicrobiia bacterium]|nr:hypothetical protein [Acidimicrobiia bacterium]